MEKDSLINKLNYWGDLLPRKEKIKDVNDLLNREPQKTIFMICKIFNRPVEMKEFYYLLIANRRSTRANRYYHALQNITPPDYIIYEGNRNYFKEKYGKYYIEGIEFILENHRRQIRHKNGIYKYNKYKGNYRDLNNHLRRMCHKSPVVLMESPRNQYIINPFITKKFRITYIHPNGTRDVSEHEDPTYNSPFLDDLL